MQESYGPLQALARDGTHRWTLADHGATFSGLVVRDDGTLLFAALGERQFGAVDAGGTVLWQKPGRLRRLRARRRRRALRRGWRRASCAWTAAGSTVWQARAGGHGAIVDGVGHGLQRGARHHRGRGRERHREVGASDRRSRRPRICRGGARAVRDRRRRNPLRRDQRPRPRDRRRRTLRGPGDRLRRRRSVHRRPLRCAGGLRPRAEVRVAGQRARPRAAPPAAPARSRRWSTALPCNDGVACSAGDACRAGQCAAASSSCGSAGAWPAVAHDAGHTRATTLLGPTSATAKWAAPGPRASVFVIAG